MIMINLEGKVVLVNAQVETVFGYTRQKLVGHTMETLIPERLCSQQPDHRNCYFDNP